MGTRAEDEYRRSFDRYDPVQARMRAQVAARQAVKRRQRLRTLFRRHRYRGF